MAQKLLQVLFRSLHPSANVGFMALRYLNYLELCYQNAAVIAREPRFQTANQET